MKKNFTKQDFYNMLRPNGDCLEWTGKCDNNGYGRTWDGRKQMVMFTHRLALDLEGIDITDKVVMHTCDNPVCCNIKHLRVGTQLENIADMVNKQRTCSHLTAQDVLDIRARRAKGERPVDIAKIYNISPNSVPNIVARRSWSHI